MKLLWLFFGFNLSAYAQVGSSICNSPVTLKKIETLASSNLNLNDNTFKHIIDNKKLVLLGETHFNTTILPMQDLIKSYYRIKGPKACVAFEFPKVVSSADQYVDSYVNAIKAAIEQVDPKDLNKVAMIPAAIKEYQTFQNYFKPLTSLASSLQMKNFCVDSADKETQEVSWTHRNSAMAENLTNLLKSGECSDVLMFVGKEHLSGQENSLKYFLSSFFETYPFVTINLQMTRETVVPQARTWADCNAPILFQPILFKSSFIESNIKIMPLVPSISVQFQDFDYTLLLP